MAVFEVGAATITRIEEVLERGFAPAVALPGFDPALLERVPQLGGPDFYDRASGRLMSSIQSWLIRLDGRTILVDTCSGNGKTRALPLLQRFHELDLPWIENLRAAGVAPEDVDLVVNTHLHIDHVGWNTRAEDGRWVPTFPNARYLIGRAEYAHWSEGGAGRRLFPHSGGHPRDRIGLRRRVLRQLRPPSRSTRRCDGAPRSHPSIRPSRVPPAVAAAGDRPCVPRGWGARRPHHSGVSSPALVGRSVRGPDATAGMRRLPILETRFEE